MIQLCLIPLVLAGYTNTLDWSKTPPPNENSPMIEVQTCETGLGGHVKGTVHGLYSAGVQYGITLTTSAWSATLQPRMGISYTNHVNKNLPQQTQFEVGAQLLLGYDQYRVALDYWHLSNGGTEKPNIGMDMLGLLAGITF